MEQKGNKRMLKVEEKEEDEKQKKQRNEDEKWEQLS